MRISSTVPVFIRYVSLGNNPLDLPCKDLPASSVAGYNCYGRWWQRNGPGQAVSASTSSVCRSAIAVVLPGIIVHIMVSMLYSDGLYTGPVVFLVKPNVLGQRFKRKSLVNLFTVFGCQINCQLKSSFLFDWIKALQERITLLGICRPVLCYPSYWGLILVFFFLFE